MPFTLHGTLNFMLTPTEVEGAKSRNRLS
jgi:hypothetical protein